MRSYFSSDSIVSCAIVVTFFALTIWPEKNHAQTDDQTRIDKAVQVVRELCLAGQQYDLSVDAEGNIVIKSLQPGVEGYAAFSAKEIKGATAIYNEKLRIIADAEVRNCTKEYLPRIIEAIFGPSLPPQPPGGIQPIDPEGLKGTAAALATEGEKGHGLSTYPNDIATGNSLIEEYNQLVRRAISLFKTDPYIQSIKEVDTEAYPDAAARKVERLAKELFLYLTSFEASKALKQSAAALAKEGEEGRNWSTYGKDINAGNSLVWGYNDLVRRVKILFGTNPSIQVFEDISEERYPRVAAGKVERLASELERALASL
ncbi:MAG: hypothetical protein ACRESZ_07525 [Methylococcales bacterium]